ncbi:MAG TPA: V4R domain-containing protein [Gemmatimonadaceae bacterium]|nr:V4R domain-containing protein [Gemmatimonadaceae bacterium]
MSHNAVPLSHHRLVAVSRSALDALRRSLLRDGDAGAATALREAGYAAGEGHVAALGDWVRERRGVAPNQLSLEQFSEDASAYFSELGWGAMHVTSLDDAVVAVDAPDWWESAGQEQTGRPECHLTTGMLAALFQSVAGAELGVLEVECRSAGDARCRFLVGAGDVLAYVHDAMTHGTAYRDALARVE